MTSDLYMGFAYPVDHDSANVWGALIISALGTIGAHDHTPGKGKLIPSGGVGIDADLTFGSFSAINMKALDFAASAASGVTGYAGALFMSDGTGGLAANELYWRTTTGVNVKLTTGAALNIAGFSGGIGGDYSTVGAVAAYDDALKRYTWKEGTLDAFGWARMACADVRMYPLGGISGNYVGQACPAAIASPYSMTWPLALPGAAAAVQVDNTGALSFSNTFAALITANAGVTAAVNQHVTLSGTGDLKHGKRTLPITGHAFHSNNAAAYGGSIGVAGISAAGVLLDAYATIPLRDGDRILEIRFFVADSATGPTKVTGVYGTISGAAGATIAGTPASAGTGANQTLSILAQTTTITAGLSYWLRALTTSGTNFTELYMVEIDYDHP